MRKTHLLFLIVLMLLFAVLPALGEETSSADSKALSLLVINVRKADALLLRCGDTAYLIDIGTEESYEQMVRVLRDEGITRLTGVIITHTDKDHAGGLMDLMGSDIEIENVYASEYFNKKKESKHPAVKALKGTGQEVIFLSAGDTLPLDGGKLTVLGPLEWDEEKENNNSLVLLAEGGGGSILLTGDMELPEEESLLEAGMIPHADVLKVGNHGNGDATSEELIKAVSPSLAVISTNTEDKPDSPDSRVMKLLESSGAKVVVTQDTKNGILVTLKDGNILTEKK
ncbi:MAG: MBL fold metallo-hydrolase [Clostridia bacterium]|nr:MBL fold metallo-hydrolase [Clostridia bacterium]